MYCSAPMGYGLTKTLQLIPPEARRNNVCLKWEQTTANTKNVTSTKNMTSTKTSSNEVWTEENKKEMEFSGCWAMDNFYIHSLAQTPNRMVENFDPVDPSNWLFFPGGKIKVDIDPTISSHPYHD